MGRGRSAVPLGLAWKKKDAQPRTAMKLQMVAPALSRAPGQLGRRQARSGETHSGRSCSRCSLEQSSIVAYRVAAHGRENESSKT